MRRHDPGTTSSRALLNAPYPRRLFALTPLTGRIIRTLTVPIILVSLLASPARAADISVCPSGCDHTTIASAISAATADDVIKLRAGVVYTENLVIAKGLTIEGEGPGPSEHATINGLGSWSTLTIETGARVTLRYVTVSGGIGTEISEQLYGGGIYINHANAKVTIESSRVENNSVQGDGGGIYVDAGTLDLVDSVVTGNVATLTGGGVYNDDGGTLNIEGGEIHGNRAELASDPTEVISNGGGVFNRDEATITDAHIHDNHATTSGGGVMNRGRGEMVITNTTIESNTSLDGAGVFNGNELTMEGGGLDNNSASESGGGLYTIGVATLSGLTIDGNTAAGGAGVYARKGAAPRQDGELEITGCSMIGNKANTGLATGGAVLADRDGDITIELCTISGNEAARGAALSESESKIEVQHATIVNNISRTDGTAVINASGTSSIRLGNSFIHNPGVANCSLRLASLGHNLDGDETCEFSRTGDISPRSVTIEGLADNGGPSRTHSLAPDSPAIDAGHPGICPDKDQRGFGAPVDGDGDGTALCDIGAFEHGASEGGITPSPGVPTPSPTTESTPPPGETPTVLENPIFLPKLEND